MTELDWFGIITGSLGGVALLMYGIRIMGDGLEAAAGSAIRRILAALTRNAWLACGVGALVTGIVQSSTAVTVMTVGFVNAQLMTFRQALGVIYGANIGTTVTGQIMAFQIDHAALPAIAVGFTLNFFAKRRLLRNLGLGILGFGMMFLGLVLLKEAMVTLKDSDLAVNMFSRFSTNLVLAVVAGAVTTMLIHSSSAAMGVAMTLAANNLITLEAAVALMLGNNIGTCITAQVASIGTQPMARRTAWAHTIHNVVGVVLALALLKWFLPVVVGMSPPAEGLPVGSAAYEAALQRQVANSHSLFNILDALLFLIFNSWFATVLERWIPDARRDGVETTHIDLRLLDTPTAAAGATLQELGRMARACRILVRDCTHAVLSPERAQFDDLRGQDEAIDQLQESITAYVIELMGRELPDNIAQQVPAMLHITNDLERVGDHCKNLIELAEERREERLEWTEAADSSVRAMAAMVDEMLGLSVRAFAGENGAIPARILALEEQVNNATELGRAEHMERARAGVCLALSGVLFLDTLMNYEKIGDHVRNIAHALADGLMEAGAMLHPADEEEPLVASRPPLEGPGRPQPQPKLPLSGGPGEGGPPG